MGKRQDIHAPQVGVGAVVIRDNAVLLVKRGHPPHAGEWAIPGGKVQLGETLQQAAEREISEETGILIKAGEPVFAFDLIERDPNGRVQWHYVIIDVVANYDSGEIQAGDDAIAAGWYRSDDLVELKVNPTTLTLLKTRFGF